MNARHGVQVAENAPQTGTPRRYRVLIVDDADADRTLCRRLLERASSDRFEFTEANSFRAARDSCRDRDFDCILLDYRLPDGTGLDFLAELAASWTPTLPAIVVLTGQGDEAVAAESIKRGAHDYLVKGRITQASLRRAVHNAMEKAELLRQIERQRHELNHLATHDELTGLFNRREIFRVLADERARAERTRLPFCLFMFDVDHFKSINDEYGHVIGDRLLCALTDRLRANVRRSDFAGRYGGDEFCVLLPRTDLAGAQAIAESLRRAIGESPFPVDDGPSLAVTCSVGVAQWGADGHDADGLLSKADARLYRAKRAGRNRVCIGDD